MPKRKQSDEIQPLLRELRELHNAYPGWTLDNVFVHWFIQAFLVSDSAEAAKYVTGVSHDKGIDGIYIDDRLAKVFLLQGKLHKGDTAPQEPYNEVMTFARVGQKVLGSKVEFETYVDSMDPRVRARLEEARDRLKKRKYELALYYVTTGRCSAPLKDEAEAEASQAVGACDLTILDRREVLLLLRDYLSGAAPPVPYLDLPIDTMGVTDSAVIQRYDKKNDIESWIFSMRSGNVAELFSRAGDRLFSRNIRGFLGSTEINKGMRKTLSDSPDTFWYYNNGITIVCDAARKTTERGTAIIRVSNPQIINGQQTTRSLYGSGSKTASVLIRVMSIHRNPSADHVRFERLVSEIVAATNWQNAILPSDLRANDSIQVSIERDLAKLGYQYLRKRQTKREARRILGHQGRFQIKKEELAQMVGACEFDPAVVRGGKEHLFRLENEYYECIFDSRAVTEYLSIYWFGRLVKRSALGYPERAYARWLVMNFLWPRVHEVIKSKRLQRAFREECERNRFPDALEKAIDETYRATLDFYRQERGRGAKAMDHSTFFKRAKLHEGFAKYWNGRNSKHRARVDKAINSFASGVKEIAAEQ